MLSAPEAPVLIHFLTGGDRSGLAVQDQFGEADGVTGSGYVMRADESSSMSDRQRRGGKRTGKAIRRVGTLQPFADKGFAGDPDKERVTGRRQAAQVSQHL